MNERWVRALCSNLGSENSKPKITCNRVISKIGELNYTMWPWRLWTFNLSYILKIVYHLHQVVVHAHCLFSRWDKHLNEGCMAVREYVCGDTESTVFFHGFGVTFAQFP